MPLSGAAAFTLVVVQAIWVWNELLIALVFLQDENARTLMAGLAQFQGRYSTNQPLVLAGALVSIAARRAALPLGPALLRARPDGRHRQVARTQEGLGVERGERPAERADTAPP